MTKRDRRTAPFTYSTMFGPKTTEDGEDDSVYLTPAAVEWLRQNDDPNRNAPTSERRREVIDESELRRRRDARARAEQLFKTVKVVKGIREI
jgi:hypothetical protein